MSSRLLYLLSHIVIAVKVEDIRNQIKGVLVVLDIGLETSEVEAICQVILVYLAEVLISAR